MDLFEALMTQKSIRRYTDEPVSDEEVWTCLRAAIQAPNGGNMQPWHWLVVTDAEKRKQIGQVYRRAFDRYEPAVRKIFPPPQIDEEARQVERTWSSGIHLADHLGEAPVLVMLLSQPAVHVELSDEQGPLDTGSYYTSIIPALQNLMLAARGLGIGTCPTTLYRTYQDDIRSSCGIPADYEIEVLVPMGRPRGNFGIAPRRPVELVTSWDEFGKQRTPV